MPFQIITGTFHVVGYSPDGDSIRFAADDVAKLFDLDGAEPRVNARGHTQLRFEGIDSLETHFSPANGGTLHQPLAFATQATDLLLQYLGITNVVWNASRTTVASASDGTRGFILSRSVEKNGRPVAFVYLGDPPAADGTSFRLEAPYLRGSYNHRVLLEGLAYATYYWGLFSDLRDELTAAVTSARADRRGLYGNDVTNEGFEIATITDLTDTHVMMPKLFRRLSEYFASTGSIVDFKRTLEASQEPVLEIATANFTHFDTFVEQAAGSNRIRLTARPEQLVFDPMPLRPTNTFALVVEHEEELALERMLADR
ncbi:hypothetical protein SLT36_20015 [Aminobacter sp. BA135]|uniref:hypothetical protein n=1 Tax=Aminobacter sp. BA135 TaxID=537596 RepID=UPI003D7B6DDC